MEPKLQTNFFNTVQKNNFNCPEIIFFFSLYHLELIA